jgi:predicted aspartyl protease/Flp pilus assembly protein TadD
LENHRSGIAKNQFGRNDYLQHLSRHFVVVTMFFALCLTSFSSAAGCKLDYDELSVHIVNSRPVANVSINGIQLSMLVDSGAFFSFLTPSTAAHLKLPLKNMPDGLRVHGYTGPVEAKLTRVEKLRFGVSALSGADFIVGGSELGAGISGILGRNILAKGDTEYDLANGVVRLFTPKGECKNTDFAYWAGEAPVIVVPLDNFNDQEDTTIRVRVKINGKRDDAMLDTGAATTSITYQAARRAGIGKRELTPNGRVGGSIEGFRESWIGDVSQIEIGQEKIKNVRLQVNDVEENFGGMLIGLDYFLSHRIYVSQLQNQLYATWNGVPVFARARATDGQYDAKYAALPNKADENDASALARRGSAATAAGNYDSALADLNQANKLAPTVAEYKYLRAQLHFAMRHSDLALADFNEAVQLDPAHAEARYQRAYLRFYAEDKQGAIADLKELDETLPPTAHQRVNMANLYTNLALNPQAFKQFDLWINSHRKDNKLAGALNNRCWLRARLNIELSLALQDCKEAVNKDDDNSAYHDSLGWTYLRLDDAAQAKKAFDNALENDLSPVSMYGRAIAKLKLNDTKGAEADFAKARAKESKIDEKIRQYGFTFIEEAKAAL